MAKNNEPLFCTYVVLPPLPESACGIGIAEPFNRLFYLNSLRYPHLSLNPGEYILYANDLWKSVSFLRKFIRQEKIEIVHVNEVLDLSGMLAARLEGLPLITHLRANIQVNWVRKFLALIVNRLSTRIISVSEACARNFFENELPPQVTVIYNPGPDPQVFGEQFTEEHLSALREELGIPLHDRIILVVAKLHPLKGQNFVIRALPVVINQHPHVTLLLVGGPLERYKSELLRLQDVASSLGIERKVVLAGFRSDVAALMTLADVVVFPSLHDDPFPGVVLEAMTRKKPLVASRVGGVPEQITSEESGLFVEPGNSDDIARQINRILAVCRRGTRVCLSIGQTQHDYRQ